MDSLTRSPDGGLTARHETIDAAPDRDVDAVEVRGLCVSRGGRSVLHRLDLRVARGSVTGLLGPSGCGKTTLLRTIVGVQKTEAGRVRVLGTDAGSPALRKRVGYVTQAPSVYADLTIAENLRYFADVLGAPRNDPVRVLDQVGLQGREHDLVGRLSGGQRARVSLAAALLGAPELLVLDEPTVGLDPVLRQELWQLFHRLADHGTTLLISSHVMDEAERCTRLLLMRDGRLLADDTPAGLLAATGAPDIEQAFLRLVSGPTAHAHATRSDSLDRPAHEQDRPDTGPLDDAATRDTTPSGEDQS